jgi:hypothetical protein
VRDGRRIARSCHGVNIYRSGVSYDRSATFLFDMVRRLATFRCGGRSYFGVCPGARPVDVPETGCQSIRISFRTALIGYCVPEPWRPFPPTCSRSPAARESEASCCRVRLLPIPLGRFGCKQMARAWRYAETGVPRQETYNGR